jgi:5-methylcytosine-specific restriction endonuclease McrA
MNYERIYAEFIADRRSKESALIGYTEKHHIVPSSRGGTDAPSNLIRLTPEDHIRAHILLGRIYKGKMWNK